VNDYTVHILDAEGIRSRLTAAHNSYQLRPDLKVHADDPPLDSFHPWRKAVAAMMPRPFSLTTRRRP
jgi:hypothetical protein